MKPSIWALEKWRIATVVFVAVLAGFLTNAWAASIILSLLGYIIWIYLRLQQFYVWINSGASQDKVSDSGGIWDKINYQVLQTKNTSNLRKKRMNALLKRSQSIVKGLPYATIVLNNNNEIDWSNKMSYNLLGIKAKNDSGQRIDNLIRLPKLRKMLATNETHEVEIESPTDSSLQLLLKLIPIGSDSKLLIARDVSERNKILEMRKSFIANASHELRAPLTVILGYLEMIKEDKSLSDSTAKAIQASYDQSERMHHIINDLLTLSRLESNNFVIDLSVSINMSDVINKICHDLNREISVEITSNEPVLGIETEIISLCTNLIQNAILHTVKDTPIIVRWRKGRDNGACFDVQDFGEGVAEKHLQHLTERFYRVDKGRSKQGGGTGTGLGLAIVWHIAQKHNAVLNIQSKVGKGSTFTVCFVSDN